MLLSQVDRMSAVILAKTIASSRAVLDMRDELTHSIKRLYQYKMFSVGEICDIAKMSEYKVRKILQGEEEFTARTGVKPSHLDHLLRMIGSPEFTKLHINHLIKDGATFAGIARVTGTSETTLRRWAEREETNG